ncbi:hypothetical protein CONPUDRAFT_158921 [Coniophora puteana RWD-64-598 SS2]|uniref:Uncharacterized protein n=1 Tax=Coniophora puteana (strain RWD-64-598) TaxID=741705 RepID=A0A5M3M8F9_CONPW|nr:uncharacterized protein CONPUDRAFT_158921 [Coniophora puteana RWD-64-598 SS2]EIW75459.1 hypothetical protein CONPUDRAFT_158921 [Coniophora puteana RWD-64-598 SS2]
MKHVLTKDMMRAFLEIIYVLDTRSTKPVPWKSLTPVIQSDGILAPLPYHLHRPLLDGLILCNLSKMNVSDIRTIFGEWLKHQGDEEDPVHFTCPLSSGSTPTPTTSSAPAQVALSSHSTTTPVNSTAAVTQDAPSGSRSSDTSPSSEDSPSAETAQSAAETTLPVAEPVGAPSATSPLLDTQAESASGRLWPSNPSQLTSQPEVSDANKENCHGEGSDRSKENPAVEAPGVQTRKRRHDVVTEPRKTCKIGGHDNSPRARRRIKGLQPGGAKRDGLRKNVGRPDRRRN